MPFHQHDLLFKLENETLHDERIKCLEQLLDLSKNLKKIYNNPKLDRIKHYDYYCDDYVFLFNKRRVYNRLFQFF
jgi:hypothetical protein